MTKEKFNIEEFKKGDITLKIKIPVSVIQTVWLRYNPKDKNLPITKSTDLYIRYEGIIGSFPENDLYEALDAEGAEVTILDQEA